MFERLRHNTRNQNSFNAFLKQFKKCILSMKDIERYSLRIMSKMPGDK